MGSREFIVAIDGTAASGKSTTARLAAKKLGFLWMDTGAMYRAITLKIIEKGRKPKDLGVKELKRLLNNTKIELNSGKVLLDGKDVTQEIRSQRVERYVSEISDIPEVREAMVRQQRELSKGKRIICEGRDIGTVVFPHAELKIFMDADIRERAKRRRRELGNILPLLEVERKLKRRDEYDSKRTHSPLKKTDDAILLDTTSLSIKEEVDFLVKKVREKL